jgi:hypothetical protein
MAIGKSQSDTPINLKINNWENIATRRKLT